MCIEEKVLFKRAIILVLNEREKEKVDSEKDGSSGALGLPKYVAVKEEDWIPDMNEETAVLLINDLGKESYYINMDNKYLKDKIQEFQDNRGLVEFYEQLYLYNMLFLAMSIKNNQAAADSSKSEESTVEDEVEVTTRAYSRVFFINEYLTNEMRKKLTI